MKYKPLPFITQEAALRILKNGNADELRILPLSLGEYCEDWKFAQDICLELLNNADDQTRVSAAYGLSYIARNHRMLEKKSVEEIIFRAYRNPANKQLKEDIKFAICDIYLFMKWKPSLRVLPDWLIFTVPPRIEFIILITKDFFKSKNK